MVDPWCQQSTYLFLLSTHLSIFSLSKESAETPPHSPMRDVVSACLMNQITPLFVMVQADEGGWRMLLLLKALCKPHQSGDIFIHWKNLRAKLWP